MDEEKGYVLRFHELFEGKTYFKGKKRYSDKKNGIAMSDTYTFKGAKIAAANIASSWGNSADVQVSIERLEECYFKIEELADTAKNNEPDADFYNRVFRKANQRLDELWEGNDFDNGDKMRINEVRRFLNLLFTGLNKEEE